MATQLQHGIKAKDERSLRSLLPQLTGGQREWHFRRVLWEAAQAES